MTIKSDEAVRSTRQKILDDYIDERCRQEEKFPDQHLPDGTGDSVFRREKRDHARQITDRKAAEGTVTWKDVLVEEVLESFCEVDAIPLRAELIQVMATAGRWIEDIDRRGTPNHISCLWIGPFEMRCRAHDWEMNLHCSWGPGVIKHWWNDRGERTWPHLHEAGIRP